MTELTVKLDFTCVACHNPVGVTVRCAGRVLGLTANVVARVVVPCPSCEQLNKLTFDPDGTVHAVQPHHPGPVPEPSVN
jgi:phage FluMu protein Com